MQRRPSVAGAVSTFVTVQCSCSARLTLQRKDMITKHNYTLHQRIMRCVQSFGTYEDADEAAAA